MTNDDFDDAYLIASIPFTALTNTSGATRQNEPNACAPTGGTVWYRYRPLRDEGLVASTIGTKHATALAVFTGTDRAHLTQVKDACHTSVQGSAYISFPAKRATTYFFQVTAVAGGGPQVFNLDPLGTTEKVSLSFDGKQGDSYTTHSAISADGRYVVMVSGASNLVSNDRNGVVDVFVRDLLTAKTERVSISSSGEQGDRESAPWPPAISADGRFVAFTSDATNLVGDGNDTNDWPDAFLHDRVTHKTTRVSVSSDGRQGEAPIDPYSFANRSAVSHDDGLFWFGAVSISADGRFVAFDSGLTGLVPDDGSGAELEAGLAGEDVFVHDRINGQTTLVSRSSGGDNANAWSAFPAISADGRFVTFKSSASNLPGGDPGANPNPWFEEATRGDVFVHDRTTEGTELVSVSITGQRGNGGSYPPDISSDGRYVTFGSLATDLVPGDANAALDFFVRDRQNGRTELVSISTMGEQQLPGSERGRANDPKPAISWDGRYVAFHSGAPNLVPGDTNDARDAESNGTPACLELLIGEDVFVRDRLAGTTVRVSVSTAGTEGNGGSLYPSISADGQRVIFWSAADNLVAGDWGSETPRACDEFFNVFLHTFPVLH